jgi:hypothetical protein
MIEVVIVNYKLIVIGLSLIFSMAQLNGCISPDKTNYQTFYSNDLNNDFFILVENLPINISEDEIENITQDGKYWQYRIDYPMNWTAQFYMGGLSVFPVIFFPITTNFSQVLTASHITIDVITSSGTLDLDQLKIELKIDDRFMDYSEKDYKINKYTKARIFIGHVNFSNEDDYSNWEKYYQGFAMISYNNDINERYELYLISSHFINNNQTNIVDFNHMVKSFKKLNEN